MPRLLTFSLAGVLSLLSANLFAQDAPADKSVPAGVWVRPGYKLTVAAVLEDKPRFLCFGPDGTLFVSHPGVGSISILRGLDGNGFYQQVGDFITDMDKVQAMQWVDGELWFARSGSIYKTKPGADGKAADIQTIIPEGQLPKDGGHWWRSLLIYKGRLYTSIGDPENLSDQTATDREKIWTYDLKGGDKKLFISGIRNTEKLVVRPGTDEIWGMDHGSDWFGKPIGDKVGMQPITDLNPPDEMNHYVEGNFYGHPFIVGNKIPRYEFMNRPDIIELADKTVPPEWCTPAHWAPNAMCFYDAKQFPGMYGDAFVAFHGSWNRKVKAGYQVARVLFEDGHPYGQLPMVKFLDDKGNVLGRPTDVAVAPDGSLLISDDYRAPGYIYRLTYVGK